MRGVFLAVSLSNGTMFFLDLYDLNAPCRGGEGAIACSLAETGSDQFASIRRHRRRFGFTPATFIAIDGTPSLQFNTAPGKLDETSGEPLNSDGPGLEFISCPASMPGERSSMINVFGVSAGPSNDDALICTSSQVWSNVTQRWDARWGGLIPQSEGGLGLFSDESFDGRARQLVSRRRRAAVPGRRARTPAGASGIDTGLSIDLVDSYGGDRVLIVGELPPEHPRRPRLCKQVQRPGGGHRRLPGLVPDHPGVQQSARDRPVAQPQSVHPRRGEVSASTSSPSIRSTRRTRTRSPGRRRGSFTESIPDPTTGECVSSTATRPVVGDDTGEVLDVDTFLTGRAFRGLAIHQPKLVSFPDRAVSLQRHLPLTDSTVALLNFNILNQFGVEVLDTSTTRRFSLLAGVDCCFPRSRTSSSS